MQRGALIEVDQWIKYMWREDPKKILLDKFRESGIDINMHDSSISTQIRFHESEDGEQRFSDDLERNNSSLSSRSFNVLDSSTQTEMHEMSTQTEIVQAEGLQSLTQAESENHSIQSELEREREIDTKGMGRMLKIQFKMSKEIDEMMKLDDFQRQVVVDCCEAFALQAESIRVESILLGKEMILNLEISSAEKNGVSLNANMVYKEIISKLEENPSLLTRGKCIKHATAVKLYICSRNDPLKSDDSSGTFIMNLFPPNRLSSSLGGEELTAMLEQKQEFRMSMNSLVDRSLLNESSQLEISERDNLNVVGGINKETEYRKFENAQSRDEVVGEETNSHVQDRMYLEMDKHPSISADVPSNRSRGGQDAEAWQSCSWQTGQADISSSFSLQQLDHSASSVINFSSHSNAPPYPNQSHLVRPSQHGSSKPGKPSIRDDVSVENPHKEIYRGLSLRDLDELRTMQCGEDIESAIALAMRYDTLKKINDSRRDSGSRNVGHLFVMT
eukprot:753014-Hanusia_phi.AAC.1